MTYSTPTRRHSRRVVRLLMVAIAGLFLVFGTWRLWVTRDTTTHLGPADAIASVRFFKTMQVATVLSEKMAGKQIVPGISLGPDDLLSLCRHSCTLWIGPNGTVEGITVDTALTEQIIATAAQYGAVAKNQGATGFIGLSEPTNLAKSHHLSSYWHRFFPWNDGEVSETGSRIQRPLSLNEHGISLSLANAQPTIPDAYTFSTTVTTTSDTVFSAEEEQKDRLLSALALGGGINEISSALTKGVRIMTGEDSTGAAIALFFQEESLTDAGAEMIATALLAKNNLATQELTFKDGTSAAELRSDLRKVTKNTPDAQHIQWKDEKGNQVFFTKDQENGLIIITNRELIPTEHALSHVSACFPDAASFTRTDLLRERGTVLDWFGQIAWNKRETKACW